MMLLIDNNNKDSPKKGTFFQKLENFFLKLKICSIILSEGKFKPVLRFDNGVEIDLSNNRIILDKPFHIHCNENLTISSSKHVIIDSGRSDDSGNRNQNYSIWLNCPKDNKGLPRKET